MFALAEKLVEASQPLALEIYNRMLNEKLQRLRDMAG